MPIDSATCFLSALRFDKPLTSISPAKRAFCARICAYSGSSRLCSSPARSIRLFTMPGITASYMVGEPLDCLLYTSDAADEEDSVDLGGRRIIKKKKKT